MDAYSALVDFTSVTTRAFYQTREEGDIAEKKVSKRVPETGFCTSRGAIPGYKYKKGYKKLVLDSTLFIKTVVKHVLGKVNVIANMTPITSYCFYADESEFAVVYPPINALVKSERKEGLDIVSIGVVDVNLMEGVGPRTIYVYHEMGMLPFAVTTFTPFNLTEEVSLKVVKNDDVKSEAVVYVPTITKGADAVDEDISVSFVDDVVDVGGAGGAGGVGGAGVSKTTRNPIEVVRSSTGVCVDLTKYSMNLFGDTSDVSSIMTATHRSGFVEIRYIFAMQKKDATCLPFIPSNSLGPKTRMSITSLIGRAWCIAASILDSVDSIKIQNYVSGSTKDSARVGTNVGAAISAGFNYPEVVRTNVKDFQSSYMLRV